MTKEEFVALQLRHRESGKTLKELLKDLGVGYSAYNYWRRKFLTEEEPQGLAPISFRGSSHHQSSSAVFSGDLPSGATLLFPNGLRAHFGTGTESMLMELLSNAYSSPVPSMSRTKSVASDMLATTFYEIGAPSVVMMRLFCSEITLGSYFISRPSEPL